HGAFESRRDHAFFRRLGRRGGKGLGPLMLFNTLPFFVFLAVVVGLFYMLPRAWRKYLLLAASYFFYASWNPKFIALLLALTVIDYSAGLWLERVREDRRKLVLVLSLAANL